MKKQTSKRHQAIVRRRIFLSLCSALLIIAVAAVVLVIGGIKNAVNSPKDDTDSDISSSSKPRLPYVVSSANVISTGDILIHDTIINGAYDSATGNYDFSDFFPHAKKYLSQADLAVANLEVTLGGTESGKYSGYPAFNCPDSLTDTLKDAGIDLLLTANNHCYDTGLFGLKRTLDTISSKGLSYIGTRKTTDTPFYTVKKVNGINIGMTVYTYENTAPEGRKSINGSIIATEANSLINSFSYDRIDAFYADARQAVEDMKKAGADSIVFYMHWGEEYQLSQNNWQKTIAQQLCNMGVDIIIGGHPHVIQPMELLTSEDSQNTTVCIYSLGNAISNQRQEIMNPECVTGHTEDAILFSFTLDKYSDGSTVISDVNVIPAWVDRYKVNGKFKYTMYPLEKADDGINLFGLTGTAATKSQKSYERTMALVSSGLQQCRQAIVDDAANNTSGVK